MNKTIYLRDGERMTWERVQRITELMNTTMSSVIAQGIRRYVEENEAMAKKIEDAIKQAKEV